MGSGVRLKGSLDMEEAYDDNGAVHKKILFSSRKEKEVEQRSRCFNYFICLEEQRDRKIEGKINVLHACICYMVCTTVQWSVYVDMHHARGDEVGVKVSKILQKTGSVY